VREQEPQESGIINPIESDAEELERLPYQYILHTNIQQVAHLEISQPRNYHEWKLEGRWYNYCSWKRQGVHTNCR
jgi:hypothetical protein